MLAVSLITEILGGNRRIQIFAAALAATVPAGILGASNVKNDYVLSYWVVLTVYFLLRWRTHQTWPDTLAITLALSLAVFTKGTAYSFLPFLAMACVATWDWLSVRRILFRFPVIALILICINSPLWVRNYRFSGSIFGLPYFDGAGPDSARLFANSHITLARSIASFLREVGLNLALPNHRMNEFTTHVLSGCIRLLGEDPNDHGQIVIGQSGIFRPFTVAFASRNEALTGNTLHFLLFVAALLVCLFAFRKMNRAVIWLGAGLVGAFFLYSALLRWSPFNARYQLPLFTLSAVVVALAFSRVLPRVAVTCLTALVLVCAIPPTLANQARPLLTASGFKGSILVTPRDQTYFFDQHQVLADSFIAAAKATSATGCKSIGVDANLLHYEYPLFALLTEYGGAMKISYVGVDNPTASFKPNRAEAPCRIVCLGCAEAAKKWAEYSGESSEAEKFGGIVVFVPSTGTISETETSTGPIPAW
jgi:4-amino-4-deoxy-L-arabinose transferase-like glycosyltransferase